MPLNCWGVPPCDDDRVRARKSVRTPEGSAITGVVRADGDTRALARRLEPGDIAVVDIADLGREAAELLAARRPAAVLDASDAATGRLANLGPAVLLEAGIPLIDQLGTEVLALREGQAVRLEGPVVWADDAEVAEGRLLAADHLEAAAAQAREGARFQLDGVSAAASQLLAHEHQTILGTDQPELPTLAGRPVLVVAPRATTASTLARIRPWIREARPAIVAVEAAADTVMEAGLTPDVVVGPFEDVSEAALGGGAHLVLHAGDGARPAGRVRTEELGIEHTASTSTLPTSVLALLLAGHAGASVVVAAGMDEGPEEVLDAGREAAAAIGLARHVLGERLVYAGALPLLTRPRIRTWQLLVLALVALLALTIALLATPVGQAALGVGPEWLKNLFDAAPKEELWSTSATTSYL